MIPDYATTAAKPSTVNGHRGAGPVLGAAHEDFRARVRSALGEIVLPHADLWEQQRHIPAQAWKALGDRGLLRLPHEGPGFLDSVVFCEELGRTGYAGLRAAIAVHAYMAASYLHQFGNGEQRRSYLEPAQRGEKVAALAITEPDAGSDLRRLATRADKADDAHEYRLTGVKAHVANGIGADFAVTVALTSTRTAGLAGASVLIADLDGPAVQREAQQPLGFRSSGLASLVFDQLPVPTRNLLGPPGRALRQVMHALDFERLIAGILALGGATYTLELLASHTSGHMVGDTPLSSYQSVRHRLVDLTGQLALIRQFAYYAAWQHSRGRLDTLTASTLKQKATELELAAALTCLHYHGARGYHENSTPARLYRDAAATPITAGVNELLKDLAFEAAYMSTA
ncbi:acyl-CoA dehydrogenase family protein [Mycobacterium intracellulare]|uniref:acyl-CoA dehydrogenase family protein n=1 Tax=Mycobacterium intracellulare TaxID=1767 RepID=UPI001EED9762|nr:acyl-CoA dehydrogenase family protein [Mycobacterium intracellulare]MEE3755347.1 acyl-CoA dehydrogenase family protein [Mycobacterium intracellulare]